MLNHAKFLAEARRREWEVEYISGQGLEAIATKSGNQPQDVVDRPRKTARLTNAKGAKSAGFKSTPWTNPISLRALRSLRPIPRFRNGPVPTGPYFVTYVPFVVKCLLPFGCGYAALGSSW